MLKEAVAVGLILTQEAAAAVAVEAVLVPSTQEAAAAVAVMEAVEKK